MGNDSWSKDEDCNPFDYLSDTECLIEKRNQPRINKGKERYVDEDYKDGF